MKRKLYSKTIFANSPYGLAVTDLSGSFLDVNNVFADIIGRTVDQIKSLRYHDIAEKSAQKEFDKLSQSLNTGQKIGPIRKIYVHATGKNIEVFVSATLLKDDDVGEDIICWFVEEASGAGNNPDYTNEPGAIDYKLLLSAAQARSILKTATDAIITITGDGLIHSFNPAAETMFGYSVNEVVGKNVSMLMPNNHQEQHDQYISNYAKTGNAKVIGIGRETEARRKDGSSLDIHLAISETVVEGKVLFTGIIRDISELKQAQHDLQLSEERFRRSQRFANIGTWDWNIKTGDLYWSEKIYSLFGYEDNALTTSYDNFLQAVHPEDRQYVVNSVNNCVKNGEKYDIEHRCVWPDGTVRWMSERGDVVKDENGIPAHMLGVVQDITLRKNAEHSLLESEEQFRGAFESAPHGMAILSMESKWEKVNVSFREIVGYSPRELLSSSHDAIVYPDDQQTLNEGMSSLQKNNADRFQTEHRYIHKNGIVLWVLSSITLVRDIDGFPMHYICQVIDITARKEAESALRQAKLQADNANQAKSEFLSSMSHELRTPLNAIVGFSELLEQSDNLNQEQQGDLAEIKKASHHLLELINDLLDLAKIESRQLDLFMEPINLADTLKECCNLVQRQVSDKNIKLINKCNSNHINSIPVLGDKIRCKQIVLNLLTNAVKYNHDDGSVIISCQKSMEKRIRLSISDTGTGMSSDKIDSLFQPFNRLGAERGPIEGTGIGLVITKRLVEKMGGSIGVYSTVGQGSTFWIELEGAELTNQPGETDNSTKISSVKPEINSRKRSDPVLVIEDNPTSQILIKNQLQKLGFEAVIASTGQEALDLLSRNKFSILLTDINLPDIDGVSLAKQVKNTDSELCINLPVIAITANALKGDKEKYLNAGLDDYISKPVELASLENTLSKWIKGMKPVTGIETPSDNYRDISSKTVCDADCIIDHEKLTQYIGDDPILQQEILNSFIRLSPVMFNNIKQSVKNHNKPEIALESHKLKSTARTIGALKLASTCEVLENSAIDLDWPVLNELIYNLGVQISDANDCLKNNYIKLAK